MRWHQLTAAREIRVRLWGNSVGSAKGGSRQGGNVTPGFSKGTRLTLTSSVEKGEISVLTRLDEPSMRRHPRVLWTNASVSTCGKVEGTSVPLRKGWLSIFTGKGTRGPEDCVG
ncbi:hypothetical protein KM043_008418 [Ampulex compressa]|nr:hypothetical protein KM043_008418 [Ampulex compressa]